jgi:hypothetical protein
VCSFLLDSKHTPWLVRFGTCQGQKEIMYFMMMNELLKYSKSLIDKTL